MCELKKTEKMVLMSLCDSTEKNKIETTSEYRKQTAGPHKKAGIYRKHTQL